MRLRNRDGTPIDPWPFVVVAGCGVLPVLSFGPLYLGALGASLRASVAGSVAVSVAIVAGAYHRYVRNRRPRMRSEIPPGRRLQRLFYAALALIGVLLLLTVPLLGRSL
ncbi:MAG: hypothetical protein ABEH47_09185 [Haloferacaceae archaeon]